MHSVRNEPSGEQSQYNHSVHKSRKNSCVHKKNIKFEKDAFVCGLNEALVKDVYDLGEVIGEGGYGKVYKAVHRLTGQTRAIKEVIPKEEKHLVINEINILR